MPQQFALAYHQCRWNYIDQQDVAEVDAGFDKYDIPYDVIWLDIEHTDSKKYFTWDPIKFGNSADMLQKLSVKGRKVRFKALSHKGLDPVCLQIRQMVTIIDPHIKKDNSFHLYKEATDQGLFVKDKDGKEFDGWCWPGMTFNQTGRHEPKVNQL